MRITYPADLCRTVEFGKVDILTVFKETSINLEAFFLKTTPTMAVNLTTKAIVSIPLKEKIITYPSELIITNTV